MKTNKHYEVITFYVSDLGHDDIILGYTWLRKHNPYVDWRQPKVMFCNCPPSCSLSVNTKWQRAYTPKANFKAGQRYAPRVHFAEGTKDNERIPSFWSNDSSSSLHCFIKSPDSSSLSPYDEVFIAFPSPDDSDVSLHRTTQSTKLAAVEHAKKDVKTLEQMVPEQYLEY